MPDLIPMLRDALARGRGPLFRELATAIEAAIEQGDVAIRLPPERELATALDLSRSTVVAAYDELRSRGRLERRRGSGTFVVPRPRHAPGAICPDPLACIQEFFRTS